MDKKESILLNSCTSGGCGAKIGPGELSALLGQLPRAADARLLVGFDTADDAAAYRLDDDTALISTVDFFPPMVEDARAFGRIAAANALSDIYAMGGRPILALNLVCFPEHLPGELLGGILQGGAEKVAEAGAALGGGHSIRDHEPKYGLAVNGLVRINKILRNNTPRVGDKLILTKPLGTGILTAAARVGEAPAGAEDVAIRVMERLNKYAAEKMMDYDVSACTDVTGFGLLAHLLEMCGDGHTALVDADALPVLPDALTLAGEYLVTAAGQRNREHAGTGCDVTGLPFALQEILFDPQTSGGLLICVDAEQAGGLLAAIQKDDPKAALIGRIMPRSKYAVGFGSL